MITDLVIINTQYHSDNVELRILSKLQIAATRTEKIYLKHVLLFSVNTRLKKLFVKCSTLLTHFAGNLISNAPMNDMAKITRIKILPAFPIIFILE